MMIARIRNMVSALGVALVLLAFTGCEPKDAAKSDDTSAVDTTVSTTAETTQAAISTVMDCEYEPPLTTGKPCGAVTGDSVPGSCDPVSQKGCGDQEHCRFAVKMNEYDQPDSFVRVCSELVCGSRTKLPGDKCEPNQCMPGSLCVSGICKRYCRRSDGLGCAPDEFCVAAALNPEYGYCEATCNQ